MSCPTLFDYLDPELASVLLKTAEELQQESKGKRIAKTVGAGLLGTGAGYLAGGLTSMGANALHKKVYGRPIASSALTTALPLLGAGAGMAYSLYKAHEAEEIRRALESNNNQPAGRVS